MRKVLDMKKPPISQDDLTDVQELTDKLEHYIFEVLAGQQRNIGMSAIMSAATNVLIVECETYDQMIAYRNVFMNILDNAIELNTIDPS